MRRRASIVTLAVLLVVTTVWLCAGIYHASVDVDSFMPTTTAATRTDKQDVLLELQRQEMDLAINRAEHEYEPDPVKRKLHKQNDDLYAAEIAEARRKLGP